MADDHELRDLRWKLKMLARQNGRQGNTIYTLRSALAEVREITGKIERGSVRVLERTVLDQVEQIDKLLAVNAELREKIEALGASTVVSPSETPPLAPYEHQPYAPAEDLFDDDNPISADALRAEPPLERERRLRRRGIPQRGETGFVARRTIALDQKKIFGRPSEARFIVTGRSGKVRFTSHWYSQPFNARRGAEQWANSSAGKGIPVTFDWSRSAINGQKLY